jgi:uncharacterized repeat protein (TIGR03803 family)
MHMRTWRKLSGAWFLPLAAAIPSRAQTFNVLANFNRTDGADPWSMSLVQGIDGNLYGTTYSGGIRNAYCDTAYPGCGEVFEITPAGALTVVHKFDGANGGYPMAGLLLATRGGSLRGHCWRGRRGKQLRPDLQRDRWNYAARFSVRRRLRSQRAD